MTLLSKPVLVILACISGAATGMLTHNGYGGEVAAIFLSDGEGNIEAGWLAAVLFAVAIGTSLPLFLRRDQPVAGVGGAAALGALFITCFIVSTETGWFIVYVPTALLLVAWPSRQAAWPLTAAVLALVIVWGVVQTWRGLTGCCADADLRFFLVALYVTPLFLLLPDVVALRPRRDGR